MILETIKQHHRCRIWGLLISISVILFITLCAGSVAASGSYSVASGETVKIPVTNPFGGIAYLYIQGQNFPFSHLMDASGNQITVRGSGRSVELDTSEIRLKTGKRPDLGTYTIYVSNNPDATGVKNLDSGNGYWDSYTLTLHGIGITVATSSTPVVTPTSVPSTPAPTSTPIPTPASPAPFVALIAGLGVVALALRR